MIAESVDNDKYIVTRNLLLYALELVVDRTLHCVDSLLAVWSQNVTVRTPVETVVQAWLLNVKNMILSAMQLLIQQDSTLFGVSGHRRQCLNASYDNTATASCILFYAFPVQEWKSLQHSIFSGNIEWALKALVTEI